MAFPAGGYVKLTSWSRFPDTPADRLGCRSLDLSPQQDYLGFVISTEWETPACGRLRCMLGPNGPASMDLEDSEGAPVRIHPVGGFRGSVHSETGKRGSE